MIAYISTTSDCLDCSSILGTKQINYVSAKYVLDRLQDRSGAVTEYYELIKRSNLPPPFQDTHTFINRNRDS